MRLFDPQKTEDAHTDNIWAACWCAVPGHAEQLVTGSVDETVKLWTEEGGQLNNIRTLPGQTLGVVSTAAHSGGEWCASSALDSCIRVWNAQDAQTPCKTIDAPPSELWGIAFAPGSNPPQLAVAGGTSNSAALYSLQSSAATTSLKAPSAKVDAGKASKQAFILSVAYSSDGALLACGSMDGSVHVFDAVKGEFLHTLTGRGKPVRGLTFLPDSRTLVTACDDMYCRQFDVHNKAQVHAFAGHESWVLCVAAHPTGTAFFSGGSDAQVRVWDLAANKCSQVVKEHRDQVWAVAVRSDGARVASVSDDKSIIVHKAG